MVVTVAAELFAAVGSLLADVTWAEKFIVEPPSASGPTRTTSLKTASSAVFRPAAVAVIIPVPPAVGEDVVQPEGALNETNVASAGTAAFRATPWTASGPALATPIA